MWLLKKAMEPGCDRRGVIVNRDDQRVLEVGALRVTCQWYEQ